MFTGIAAILALLYFLRDILIPLVIAFVLVVIVEAVVDAIKRHWPGAPAWLVSWIAGVLVIVTAAGGIFVLAEGAVQMVGQGPALASRLNGFAPESPPPTMAGCSVKEESPGSSPESLFPCNRRFRGRRGWQT